MPLYIKFAEKKRFVGKKQFVRFDTAYSIFNTILGFLDKTNAKFILFDDFPYPSITDKLETFDLEFGLLEKIRDKISDRTGFEIKFETKKDDKVILFAFTLVPDRYNLHYDALLEIIPNGYIKRFMDIEKYIPTFRKRVKEELEKYNLKKDTDILLIDKAIVSTDGKEIHSFDEYSFFYSRNPEELITELTSLSKTLKDHLYYADKDRVAKEIIGHNRFVLLLDTLATKNAVSISAGSISVIPTNSNNMSKFSDEVIKKLEKYVKIHPTKTSIRQIPIERKEISRQQPNATLRKNNRVYGQNPSNLHIPRKSVFITIERPLLPAPPIDSRPYWCYSNTLCFLDRESSETLWEQKIPEAEIAWIASPYGDEFTKYFQCEVFLDPTFGWQLRMEISHDKAKFWLAKMLEYNQEYHNKHFEKKQVLNQGNSKRD